LKEEMPVKKDDAHKALELLEDYCAQLNSPADKQLRISIEKVIFIFKSNLFQALLDIQEFYEAILLDGNKDPNAKALTILRIADKWLETTKLPDALQITPHDYSTIRNGMNDTVTNDVQMLPSTKSNQNQISPFNNSNKSDAMSLDDPINKEIEKVPNYEDHWVYNEVILERTPGVSLGFSIAGGADNPMYGNNTAIFITKLTPGGVADLDNRLRPNDILYRVNDVNCANVDHNSAVQALKEAGNSVALIIKRLQPTCVEEICLEKSPNGLGFSISGGLFTEHIPDDHGIFITKIIPGGAAHQNGKLSVGDRLISVSINTKY
jgi:hypothetical protein